MSNITCMCMVYLILVRIISVVGGFGYNPTVNFSWQSLDEIPHLPLNIEVLDFSYNRIRVLEDGTFQKYKKLRVLNFFHNSIFSIEDYTFYDLSKLTDLNLGYNVLEKIPTNLPSSLNRLYLDNNPLIETFKYQNSCLTYGIYELHSLKTLSLRENRLQRFPKFCKHVPNLLELDVSGNVFTKLSPLDVAPLCGLQRVGISPQTFPDVEKYCQCLEFEKWARNHYIDVGEFSCRLREGPQTTTCDTEPPDAAVAIYEQCLDEARTRKYAGILLIAGGIVLASVCVVICVLCRWKRNLPTKSVLPEPAKSIQSSVTYDNNGLEVTINDSVTEIS